MRVPFETTLQLLDAADRLTAPVPVATSEELATHLQAVSASLGKPLAEDQARAAVATLQQAPSTPMARPSHATALALPHEIGWDRPRSVAELEAQLARALVARRRAYRAKQRFMRWYQYNENWTVLAFMLAFGAAGAFIATILALALKESLAYMGVGAAFGLFLGLPLGSLVRPEYKAKPWWDRHRATHLERAQRADLAIEDLKPARSPVTLDQVKTWMAVPGLSSHLYALAAAPMAFLQGDVRRLDRGLKRHHAQIQAEAAAKVRAERERIEQEQHRRQAEEAENQARREREAILTYLAPQAS